MQMQLMPGSMIARFHASFSSGSRVACNHGGNFVKSNKGAANDLS